MANVFKEAKKLQRAQPRKFANWQKAVKAAGKKLKTKGRKKPGKRTGAVKFIERGETRSTRPKKIYKVSRTKTGNFKTLKAVGKATVSQHIKAAREGLGQQYGNLAIRQFLAPTKTKRRQISKKLAHVRSQILRLK
jgi:hypothetical protein